MSVYFSSELIRIKGIFKGFRKSLGQIVETMYFFDF